MVNMKLIAGAVALATILACGPNSGLSSGPMAFDRCKVNPGDELTLYTLSSYPDGANVTIGGVVATVVGSTATGRVRVLVPAGLAGSQVVIVRNGLVNVGQGNLDVGGAVDVAETEPNDDVDGLNATPTSLNYRAHGTLASVADKDHFRFDCIAPSQVYTITVTPRVVGTIHVNGTAVTLDAAGKADKLLGGPIIIGLTGATGDYAISVQGKL